LRLAVKGMGVVKWTFMDDSSQVIELPIKDCLYVPNVLMCLLSPQQVTQQTKCKGDGFHALAKSRIFTFDGYTTSVPYNQCSQLPILSTCTGIQVFLAFNANLMRDGGKVDNLTGNQRELLHTHYQLSHIGFAKIQQLARQGLLPKNIAKCVHLICPSCQFGKAHQRSMLMNARKIDAQDLCPRDCISCVQLETNTPGMIAIKQKYVLSMNLMPSELKPPHRNHK